MNMKCQRDFIKGKDLWFSFEVVMTYIEPTGNACTKGQ